jgi:hypothetical protein
VTRVQFEQITIAHVYANYKLGPINRSGTRSPLSSGAASGRITPDSLEALPGSPVLPRRLAKVQGNTGFQLRPARAGLRQGADDT